MDDKPVNITSQVLKSTTTKRAPHKSTPDTTTCCGTKEKGALQCRRKQSKGQKAPLPKAAKHTCTSCVFRSSAAWSPLLPLVPRVLTPSKLPRGCKAAVALVGWLLLLLLAPPVAAAEGGVAGCGEPCRVMIKQQV